MKSTPHTNCTHPTTSAARAKCRKDRAARQDGYKTQLEEVLMSYWDNSTELEEIVGRLSHLASMTQNPILLAAVTGYYDSSLDAEEVITEARKAIII